MPDDKSTSQPSKSFGHSMLSTGITSAGFTILTFLSGILIARLLGVEGRGQYGAVLFWAQFGLVFFALSLRESAIVILRQDATPPPARLSSLLLYALGITIVTLMIIFIVTSSGFVAVEGVDWRGLAIFGGLVCAIAFFSQAYISVETAQLNFITFNQDRLIAPGLFVLILGLFAVFGEAKLEWILAAFILGKLPMLSVWVWRYRREVRRAPEPSFISSVAKLGTKFHLATILTLISQQVDRLIIVSVWPADRLGYYFVAYSAAGAGFTMVSQAIGLTLLPSLSGLTQTDRRDRLERTLRYTIIAVVGFAAAIILTAPLLIPLVFGTAFLPAVAYTQGLTLALAFVPIRSVVLEANRSISKGRPGLEMAIASLLVFLVVYIVTGFQAPTSLFWAIGLSHLTAILVGLRHPIQNDDIRPSHAFLPRPGDVIFLIREVWQHLPLGRR